MLMMMGMAAALIYNVVELTKKYISYPVSVKLSVDHQQELTFPSVTVCNMSPIKKSAWQAAQNTEVKSRRKRATGYSYMDVFSTGWVRKSEPHLFYTYAISDTKYMRKTAVLLVF